MTKRYDEPFAAVRNCVARDKIRCLHNEAGALEYFATPRGAEILAGVGIRTLLARHPVDAQGHQFGPHVRRVVMNGRGGLLRVLGTAERVQDALSGAKTVPLAEEVVDANIADREAMARGFETAHRGRVERAKPAYLRSGAGR